MKCPYCLHTITIFSKTFRQKGSVKTCEQCTQKIQIKLKMKVIITITLIGTFITTSLLSLMVDDFLILFPQLIMVFFILNKGIEFIPVENNLDQRRGK